MALVFEALWLSKFAKHALHGSMNQAQREATTTWEQQQDGVNHGEDPSYVGGEFWFFCLGCFKFVFVIKPRDYSQSIS